MGEELGRIFGLGAGPEASGTPDSCLFRSSASFLSFFSFFFCKTTVIL